MSTHVMKSYSRAFIYIDVKPGKEKQLLENILQFDEVLEAHLISGQYDVFAIIEVKRGLFDSPRETITNFVIEKIRKLRDVQDTNTLIPTYSVTKRE